MRTHPYTFLAIAVAALAARLCHVDILWVEEAYPIAAAREMLAGKLLYRDIWFDKPPLFPAFYLLWGALAGWPLRLAGALFTVLCSWTAWLAARRIWSEREALIAAVLMAFFLIFGIPAAVMALTPDLLMIPFHLLAIAAAASGQPLLAGVIAGTAVWLNGKALFVLAACAIWQWRRLPALTAGFLLPNAIGAAWLYLNGSLDDYWLQVWQWGAAYSRAVPFQDVFSEGARRTLNWAGFHAAALLAAIWALRPNEPRRLRLAGWFLISLAAVWLGGRFFPRYFFHLLPVVAVVSARGFALLPKRHAAALALLLLIPMARFGPRYAVLASDLAAHRPHQWQDLALDQDSRAAANLLRQHAKPGETLLVWGYRPELYPLSGLRAGTRFLDSQPLNGVLADRHLRDSAPTFPALAAENREALYASNPPVWIADGLGPLNPALAVFATSGLAPWGDHYKRIAETRFFILYRLKP